MNRRHLLSAFAVALAISAPAFADSGTPHNGPRTRAEVRAEVEQARRDGTLAYLRKATSYPQGLELAQAPYRPTPEGNQLAGAGR